MLLLRSLEHQLKCLREENDEMHAGQRGARLAKWIARSKEIAEKTGVQLGQSVRIPVQDIA